MQWAREKPEEKSSHQSTSATDKSCNPTVPVHGPKAQDEREFHFVKVLLQALYDVSCENVILPIFIDACNNLKISFWHLLHC